MTRTLKLNLLLLLIFPLTGTPLKAMGDTDISAIWLGKLKTPAVELRLAVTISQEADGSLKALLTSIDQGGVEIPMDSATLEGDTLEVKSNGLMIHIRGLMDLEGGTWTTLFKQGPALLPLVFHRVESLPSLERPQEPQAPFPYAVERVSYENPEDSIVLAGTLTIPEGEGPFPAVLLISGSGPQNRDSELMGHRIFAVLADYLTRKGIMVLRYDDRGTAESTGVFATATWDDFVSDALSGLAYLSRRPEADPDRTGIAGHSEGGTIAPLVVNRSGEVDFMIMLAAAVLPWDQISLYQKKMAWTAAGMSEEGMALNEQWHEQVTALVQSELSPEDAEAAMIELYNGYSDEEHELMGKTPESLEMEMGILLSPWWRQACKTDVRAQLRKVSCPVLAMNGEKDTQVVARDNLPAIQADLEEAPTSWFGVGSLPGLNHLFQHAETGASSEYGQIEETFAPEAMERMATFILELPVD